MIQRIQPLTSSLLSLILAVCCSSCSDKKSTSGNQSDELKEHNDMPALEAVLLQEEPVNAIKIADLRRTARPGESVVFTGKAIGAMSIFLDGRAVMVLGDPDEIISCDLIPGDNCTTPWDVCCSPPEKVKASIVTVQVVDENGKPLKAGFKGLGGIKELSHLVVKGKVAKGSNSDNMVVNASGIFVQD